MQAAVATLVGQLVQLTPRSTPTPDAALRAFARRFRGPPPRFKGAQARAQARAQGLRRELRASGRQARAQGRSWPCSCSQARREALLIVVASIQECAAGRHILGSDPNLLAPPPLPSCSRSRTTTPFPKPHTHTPQPTPPSLRVFTRSICGTRSVVHPPLGKSRANTKLYYY